MVEVVLETPVHILVLSPVLKEGVHESDVIAILTDEFCMGVACLGLLVLGTQEQVGGI
jgi:hypothetical protein